MINMASMLAPIVSTWVSMEHRKLIQVVPEPVRQVWNEWDIRGSLIVSLLCQYILAFLGKRRKYSVNHVTTSLIWVAYIVSDWVANFALGAISSKLGDSSTEEDDLLLAFWSTLLLVHLGGPASITAYALEDNALWGRNLALWIIQSIRVLYLVLLAWTNTWFSYISIVMLVAGFIKCGEKVYALYSASVDYRRDTMIPPLDPTIHDVKFTNNDEQEEYSKYDCDEELSIANLEKNPRALLENFMLLFVSLFKDVVLSYDDLKKKQSDFQGLEAESAFELVEVQLAYAYDLFFTKASVFNSVWIYHLVIITYYLSLVTCICFGVIVDKRHQLRKIDEIITCDNNYVLNKREPSKDLKGYIFNHLVKKSELISRGKTLCKYGVYDAIEEWGVKSIEWTKMMEFHQSILTWHIATDICYYYGKMESIEQGRNRIISNTISEYMLYILVKQRHMLPVGTGLISFRDTCAETMVLLGQLKVELPLENVSEACEKLMQVNTGRVRRSQSKSVIFDACKLARSLVIEMEMKEMWEFLEVVWVEILVYAATHCRADQHAQQLRKGGEFLSHVWLLSAHLGVMQQFQLRPIVATDKPLDQSINQGNRNERDHTVEDRVGEQDNEEEEEVV
ncbi:hypothetical protein G2W53_002379 [Senna tora]|uniref:DUF4220 domain-containing protein n=1 Tax=Senna tora TaxID=362788 RepID=A0A835CKA7_9FABA|nr:hypothetical protein G2W53_002379 [Senna tora]